MSGPKNPPRVLGNDPFKRAAAPQTPQAKPPEPQAPATEPSRPPRPVMTPVPPKPIEQKRLAPKPPPPPKIVVPKPKVGEGTPARRAVSSFATYSAAAPSPKVTAPERPSQKPAAPTGPPSFDPVHPQSPDARHEPRFHPGSPELRAGFTGHETSPELRAGFTAHETSPELRAGFTPHETSPELRAEFTAHETSPELRAEFTAHETSPELRAEFTAHETSPELRAEFTPHEMSPEMVAELELGRATPHQGSPAVVRELIDREAVPHHGSPELVSDRVTELAVALGAARDVGEGLARPLIDAAAGVAKAAKTALGLGSAGPVDTWGKDEGLSRSLHPLGDFLYDKYFRVTVEGAENLPAGPSIIVGNHSGALPLDGPMLYYALQRERADLASARWLVEDQVFHAPVLGVLVNRIGAVRAHPENAVRLLEEGRPVIVFPEGFLGISKPFTQKYQLKRFGRGGYVKLALKQSVPIVPVAIVGAEESMPLLAKLPGGLLGLPYLPLTPPPLPARWRIRFSEAMTVEGAAEDLAYVQEQNDRVRDTIAGMLASMLGS